MKLDGVRVLDLSLFLPGPHLAMTMADHGADVIKIEPPTGEPTRQFPYRMSGHSVWFRNTQRGKRSIVLDLKQESAREVLLRLIDTADVLIEAFRPGVMERLGVGPEVARARNPRLVWCSIAAFGQTGPLRDVPAHDLAIQARSGIVSLNLGSDGEPTHPNMPVADLAASLTALSAILMALYARERTGRGDTIDLSMQDATMAWLPNVTGPVFAEDRPPRVKQERSFGGGSFYNVYRTKDGRHVVLGGSEHKFVANLLTALGRPDLIPAASTWPGPAHEPVKAFLRETFAMRTCDEWEAWFEGRDVCFAPVLDLKEAFAQAQVDERDMLIRETDGTPHIGLPIRFAEEPGRLDPRLPGQGEHGAAILAELGYDEPAAEALLASGAVGRPLD